MLGIRYRLAQPRTSTNDPLEDTLHRKRLFHELERVRNSSMVRTLPKEDTENILIDCI
jgi:hypothetical protein